MTEMLHPAVPFFAASVLGLFFTGLPRKAIQLLAPCVSLYFLYRLNLGGLSEIFVSRGDFAFHLIRLDPLSQLFVLAFILFALLANLYALHENGKTLHTASNVYVASSIGAVLAGDWIVLFIFWEIMAVASTLLIWNKNNPASIHALIRYFLFHLLGGLFFFSGLMLLLLSGQPLELSRLPLDLAGLFIFLGFLVNAALVPFHAWLPDAYPEGSSAGSVYLCAFTTKVAVYAFARVFAGETLLVYLGAMAAVYGVFFALMEDNMRRLLSYHIVCQIGYMVCGIGLGSQLGMNAGTGHAVGNILFKGLLFMATGAVIHITGKHRLSSLGGLAKEQKAIFFFFMTGALAISGLPLLNGYVTKSLLIDSFYHSGFEWMKPVLLCVAVGTFLSIALKLAYFAFISKPAHPIACGTLPRNMTWAMAGTSLLCVILGVFPDVLFRFLPFPETSQVYSPEHIIHTLQMLAGTFLGFLIIKKSLTAKAHLTLDVDWFYRKLTALFIEHLCPALKIFQEGVQSTITNWLKKTAPRIIRVSEGQILQSSGVSILLIAGGAVLMGILLAAAFSA